MPKNRGNFFFWEGRGGEGRGGERGESWGDKKKKLLSYTSICLLFGISSFFAI
jgi:hypothetical protein